MSYFTIADVLAWARTKPADERYDYNDVDGCAIAQFALHATGEIHPHERHPLESGVVGDAAFATPRTFGAFADRLELLLLKPTAPSEWTRLDAYLPEQVDA